MARYEGVWSLKRSQKIENHSGIPICCSKTVIPENTFYDRPPPTLGTLARHTPVEICWCQSCKLCCQFVSWVPKHLWWGNKIFWKTSHLLPGLLFHVRAKAAGGEQQKKLGWRLKTSPFEKNARAALILEIISSAHASRIWFNRPYMRYVNLYNILVLLAPTVKGGKLLRTPRPL